MSRPTHGGLLLLGLAVAAAWPQHKTTARAEPEGASTHALRPAPLPPAADPPPARSPHRPRGTKGARAAEPAPPTGTGFHPQPWSTSDPAQFTRSVPRGKVAPAEDSWLHPAETPKPTSEWWQNMVLTKSDIDGNGNGFVIPYVIDPKPYGLKMAVPFPLAISNDIYENGFDTIVLVVQLGAADDFAGGYHAARHDKLTVDLEWGEAGAGMRCVLARGSPYVTCTYDGVAPSFNAPQMLETFSVDRAPTLCDGAAHVGSRFELSFVQSDETWVLYAERPLAMACNNDAARMSLDALEPYEGTLRAAMANNCTSGRSAFHCLTRPPADPVAPVFVALLDAHAHVYPTAGAIAFSANDAADGGGADGGATGGADGVADGGGADAAPSGAVHYQWRKAHFEGSNSSTPLLMVQMAHHHLAGVDGATRPTAGPFSVSLHGPAWLAVGDEWRVRYALPQIMWHAPRGVAPDLLAALGAQLELDAEWTPPLNYRLGAGDPYNAGKMLSRMARVALVAEAVGRADLAAAVVARLKPLAELYFNGRAANGLLYDKSWGGLISCGCLYDDCGGKCEPHCRKEGGDDAFCPSLTDPGMDFGNGYYNDHHFHYGYHLFAAATLAHFDRAWAEQHRERILLFVRAATRCSVHFLVGFPVFKIQLCCTMRADARSHASCGISRLCAARARTPRARPAVLRAPRAHVLACTRARERAQPIVLRVRSFRFLFFFVFCFWSFEFLSLACSARARTAMHAGIRTRARARTRSCPPSADVACPRLAYFINHIYQVKKVGIQVTSPLNYAASPRAPPRRAQARDYANPSTSDTHFPQWRNKDWYMGFSWASGIALAAGQPFRNGRNQESTSEAVRFENRAPRRAAPRRRRPRAPASEPQPEHAALRPWLSGPSCSTPAASSRPLSPRESEPSNLTRAPSSPPRSRAARPRRAPSPPPAPR
jgi:hypothetical protein